MGIWSRKSVGRSVRRARSKGSAATETSLGIVGLTAFGVGCTIGAGIFSLTGDVAAHQAGPAVTLAFMVASVACFFAGLCYAEFAAMVPIAGSAYSYAYATLGELVAWLIGWCLMLEWLFAASVVAISWSGYVTAALKDLGIVVPAVIASSPFTVDVHDHLVRTQGWVDLPAVLVTLGCTALLLFGTRTSANVNTVIVLAKVLVLIALIAVGASYVQMQNWHPFVPHNSGQFGHFGWSGVARGAATLFFAYIGFDGVSTLAEEARNPQRTVPWSLFASLFICTVLYVGVSLIITGLTDYRGLDVPDPLYYALTASHMPIVWLKSVIAIVAILGLISVVLASIIGQVRIFYAMARDGLLPAALGRIDKRRHTPYVGTLVTGIIAAGRRDLRRSDSSVNSSPSAPCSPLPWYAPASSSSGASRPRLAGHFARPGCRSYRSWECELPCADGEPAERHLDTARAVDRPGTCGLSLYGRRHSKLRAELAQR